VLFVSRFLGVFIVFFWGAVFLILVICSVGCAFVLSVGI